jgi:hypothetical protein
MTASQGRARNLYGIPNTALRHMALGAVLLVGFACTDNPADPEEGLTLAEALGLVEGLGASHAFDLDFGGQDPWPCPRGGAVSPSLFITTDTASLLTNGSLAYTNCGVISSAGDEFALSGALSVSQELEIDVFGRVIGSHGTAAGDISWRLSGRSGDCPLGLSSASAESGIRITGSVCDHPVDRIIG